jgi:hypothetical protein
MVRLQRIVSASFLVAVCGCTASTPPVPPLSDIARIELNVRVFPPGAGRQGPCTATLAAPADLADVLAWLNSFDWSQSGLDMTVVGMPEPEGSVAVIAKDGTTATFPFYWDGRVINERANRLLSGGDVTRLRAAALRGCN